MGLGYALTDSWRFNAAFTASPQQSDYGFVVGGAGTPEQSKTAACTQPALATAGRIVSPSISIWERPGTSSRPPISTARPTSWGRTPTARRQFGRWTPRV